jgi:hypothetical protein
MDAWCLLGIKALVRLNTDGGFGELIAWGEASALSRSRGTSMGANIGFTVGVTIGAIKLIVNPSVSTGKSVNRDLVRLSDVDGDSYVDFVESNQEDELKVKRSTIGRTNLLREVQKPLGASLVVDYRREDNSYQMAQDVWALSRVVMHDGYKGDGIDSLMTTFVYENGYYDRYEREFYGFGKVTTIVDHQLKAGIRLEQGFELAKGGCGLDHYEVRKVMS